MKMAQSDRLPKNVMVALAVGGAAAAVSGAMMMGRTIRQKGEKECQKERRKGYEDSQRA